MRSVPPDERGDTRPELAFPPQTTHSTSRRASEKERRTAQGVCCAQPSHGAKGRASRARGASRAKPARRRGKACACAWVPCGSLGMRQASTLRLGALRCACMPCALGKPPRGGLEMRHDSCPGGCGRTARRRNARRRTARGRTARRRHARNPPWGA